MYQDDDGTVVLRGRLTPEDGALLVKALAAARETLYQRARVKTPACAAGPSLERPTMAQQQADALALLAETALHHEIDPGAPGERYQVVVHVDAPALADPDQAGQSVLEDGGRVSAETARRLACDASRVVMQHDAEGRVVEIGARTDGPPALRRALQHRDRGCRFPGCGAASARAIMSATGRKAARRRCRTSRCSAAGITEPYEEGYHVDRQPDGALRFRRPDGRPLLEVPPPAAVPADPVNALRALNHKRGLRLHARTALPKWLGNVWIWAGQSTCCIPARGSRHGAKGEPGSRQARRVPPPRGNITTHLACCGATSG